MMKLIRQLWHRSSALTVPINKKQTAIALTAYLLQFLFILDHKFSSLFCGHKL